MKTRLYLGQKVASFHQYHQSLVIVAGQLFGSESKSSSSSEASVPKDENELAAAFASVFGA